MTHTQVQNILNNYFNNTYIGNADLDTTKTLFDKEKHISIKYIAEKQKFFTVGTDKIGGILRIHIYDLSPNDNYEVADTLLNIFDGKTVDGLCFDLFSFLQSPSRTENGNFYESALDFSVYGYSTD